MTKRRITIKRDGLGNFAVLRNGKHLCTYSNREAAEIRREIEEKRK